MGEVLAGGGSDLMIGCVCGVWILACPWLFWEFGLGLIEGGAGATCTGMTGGGAGEVAGANWEGLALGADGSSPYWGDSWVYRDRGAVGRGCCTNN